ncbi:CpaF family protein [Nanchangia anserum]|uniref:CpaF family protein n=1 Tax=Nanchangia anserum TaxID=2692125 RepID=A0A8I0KS92_9ACTO|nr:ATPase, T2SS/T4P/T4SS family [Nanchangia anserum]MBD3690172.1 CpaF family protein [Nanchangia anserum]QOX82372.1 CpaF family protein [Nanchangia anserum]
MSLTHSSRPARTLSRDIAHRLAERDIDPRAQPERVRALIAETLAAESSHEANSSARDDIEAALLDEFIGLGPLQPFLDDPEIEEIWIDSPTKVFVARGGRAELTTLLLDAETVRDLVERMLRSSGRRLDLTSPFVDATLAGGERLHVVIPPITSTHWAVNIRKHVAKARRIDDLVGLGMLDAAAAAFASGCVKAGLNICVSGATQAGKTTLLRALAGDIPAAERIVTCEEVFELHLANRDVVALQTRPATIEGSGAIVLRDLVKETLRMRPERIIVGEVRGAESLDMLIAMNAGVSAMSTVHANSARDALAKLTVLPLLAGPNVSADFVIPTVAGALDLVIHVHRDATGRRFVREIVAVTGRREGHHIEATELYESSGTRLRRTAASMDAHDRFARVGLDLDELLGR